jgi:hypothetical protein
MSKIKLNAASGGGSVAFEGPASSGSDKVIKLPAAPGVIIQVISTATSAKFSESVASAEYSGDVMTLSITPQSTSNKILCIASLNVGLNANEQIGAILVRNSTIIDDYRGASDGIRGRWGPSGSTGNANQPENLAMNYLDSPSTTSAITYRIRLGGGWGGGGNETIMLNRTNDTSNETYRPRTTSSFTLMEVTA